MMTAIYSLGWFVALILLARQSYRKNYSVDFINDQYFVVETVYIFNFSLVGRNIGIDGNDEIGFLYAPDAIRAAKRLNKGKSMYKSTNIEKEA